MLILDADSTIPLVTQIVEGVAEAIALRRLRSGARLPSIRKFASVHGISHFTVVEAYDRLVARGCLIALPNAGFFVRSTLDEAAAYSEASPLNFDTHLLLHKVFTPLGMQLCPGIGRLPDTWLDGEGMQRGLRTLARQRPHDFSNYGHAQGLPALRTRICDRLAEAGIAVGPEQMLLTTGASQALDLVVRLLVRSGDAVLVEEPGYHNLFLNLHLKGARLLGVPRGVGGLDLQRLEHLLREHHPRVMFIQSRLHSPTGTSLSLPTCHRLLQLAQQYDVLIVENDIYADLAPIAQPTLASLDQLERVIHICSLSKTIAPALRVGWISAHRELIEQLLPLKMASGLTSSELTESLALNILLQGQQRKFVRHLRERLGEAHEDVARRLESAGMELFHEPRAGLFLWARHPEISDSYELACWARGRGMLLFPGQLFMPDGHAMPWTRFNVAQAGDDRVYELLARYLEERGKG
ncbi:MULTISPECIES: PLP-dependent aminotransferase family protein [Pseudomonas]|uniref:GntR family transcriptional regulator n=1 Tax=Pseudomonas fulva TaxID=47880 RepID=A0A0D0J3Z7_9PSED|nr:MULTISPECIES: PLP-dependent aminotransferase family protein [Pseudomonas]KIQ00233.1 GntR family transcriptional regulator [Pseudomonas fulva]